MAYLAYAVRYGMCPILSSEEFVEAKSGMKERDTIPKPVGLGLGLRKRDTNSYRTGSNTVRKCSKSVRRLFSLEKSERLANRQAVFLTRR